MCEEIMNAVSSVYNLWSPGDPTALQERFLFQITDSEGEEGGGGGRGGDNEMTFLQVQVWSGLRAHYTLPNQWYRH